MSFRLYDFECECGHIWEDLVREKFSLCPKCNTVTPAAFRAPRINTFGCKDKSEIASIMKKRSDDHTAKIVKKGERG